MRKVELMRSNTEVNLGRLAKTTIPKDFVASHNGEWNHQDWLIFCASLEEKGYSFTWDENVPACLAEEAFGGNRGARDLRVTIRRQAEDKIAGAMIAHADEHIKGFVLHQDQLEILF
jgi:invasion protein IalB